MVEDLIVSSLYSTVLLSFFVLTMYFLSKEREPSKDGFVAKMFNYGFGTLFLTFLTISAALFLGFYTNILLYVLFPLYSALFFIYYKKKGPFNLKIDGAMCLIAAVFGGLILGILSLLLFPFKSKVDSYFEKYF